MNVVILSRRLGAVRQLNLRLSALIACAASVLAVFGAALFYAGYASAQRGAADIEVAGLDEMQKGLAAQKAELADARRNAEDTLDALAIRLGRMNAHVIRLDALGRRLTAMAKLEDGEFDFDSAPAIGGPEEPALDTVTGSAEVTAALDELAVQLADREKQLGVLESMLLSQNLTERTHPAGRPVKSGWISSYFGRRTDPFTGKAATHKGIDFAGKVGGEVLAVAAGVVTYSGDRYGYGLMVELDHGNGYVTRYAHNAVNLVEVGDEVARGQTIAEMGATGRATGPNLHFEVLHSGRVVNPLTFIKARGGD